MDSLSRTDNSEKSYTSLASKKRNVTSEKISASIRRKPESDSLSNSNSTKLTSSFMKPTVSTSSNVSVPRRNSTGGLVEKRAATTLKKPENGVEVNGKKSFPVPDTVKKNTNNEIRRTSLPPSISPKAPVPRLSARSLHVKSGSAENANEKSPLSSNATSSLKKVTSSSDSSTSRSRILRKTPSSVSSPRTPSGTSSFKSGSLSASVDKGSLLSSRKRSSTPDSREARLMMLPHVEIKAGDDLRLDLRGHRVRSLSASGLNLSPNLEFVYLRDNLLSSVEGIEILKRVKVLDLSFNDFKGPGFEPLENCKALQQLYLAGNQITSLASLPQLPNLEFLSVARNRLKSLSMASQPRLQVLAASKNKVSTLKGFPHLPVLEHLRVEENPILDMLHLEAASIILVGPTLKKFNDKDISHKEIEIAKRYPAHTALCIRDGWEFCRPEHAAESTFSFLLKQWEDHFPPECMLEEAFIDRPFEEDACHCHFKFVSMSSESKLALKYQWYIGEKTPTNFVPIEGSVGEVYWPKHDDIGKFLKAECTPVLEETEYPSIFAISSAVSQGTKHPKAINLIVNGELIEGNTIRGVAEVAWCGGTPGKCVSSWLRRKWNGSPVAIVGAENEEYKLTVDDIDSSLVFMYTPVTEDGIKGEPRYAMTDFVKAAPPSVKNVRIRGDIVEGNTIKGFGEYFGGKEGPSKFEWLRESKEIGGHVVVSSGSTEYTLTEEDVGRRMTFIYIPINFEGHEGEPASFMTEIVKKAPPTATNLKIFGDLREGNKVTATAIITRGTEGSSRVQWFKTSSSKLLGEFGLESISMPKIAKAFRIPLGAVGYYIVAKLTPMSPDGETGEPAYVISEKVVDTLPPSLNFLSVTGDYCEGELLTASYGYIGGHEGKSLYDWYIHEVEADEGTLVPEASGLLQYRITKDAIGKFVSFKCTPVRDDGSIGEPRISFAQERIRSGSPRLLSLRILGNCIEGTTLTAEKKYWGGEEGNSTFRWFLTSPDGEQKEIEGATATSYYLSYNDIGLHISVSCEPIRSDWAQGPIMISESIGPVLPGLPNCQTLDILGSMVEGGQLSFKVVYTGGEKGDCIHEWFRIKPDSVKEKLSEEECLDLTLEDVDTCIELLFTPIRNDGVRGQPKRRISDSIVPADPKGIKLVIPSCTQDNEIVLLKSYYGGKEGFGEYIWYRIKKKLADLELQHIAASDAIVVGKTLNYTPSLNDIDSYLALYWVPTRADGKRGDPLVAISNDPVIAGLPVVSDVCIKELGSGVFVGEGKYYGGHEGSSLFSWYRETPEGTIIIDGATSTTYQATDSDYSYRLLFGYTPVRLDSVLGELKISEPSSIVVPDKLEFESFTFNGKEMEGEILHATKIIPASEIQQHIWSKYRKELKYQWFYSVGSGPNQYFEPFPSQSSSSYKIRFEDIGRCLKCDCTVTDVFGRSTGPLTAVTSHILPGIPKIRKLEIEGRGFHTNLYALRGEYSGGREGKSKIQWLRAMVGSPDLISIPGETGRMYEANVDDVGYRIVALYTPIREDGVEGEPTTASTDPIAVEPEIYREVKQKLDLGAVKFEVLCDKNPPSKKGSEVGNLERRILEINRKRIKVVKPGSKTSFPTTEIRGTYAPPFHVELYRNDQLRFKIVVDSENEVDLMVQTRYTRDVIVLAIRGFAQRFNSTSLNSLLKIET